MIINTKDEIFQMQLAEIEKSLTSASVNDLVTHQKQLRSNIYGKKEDRDSQMDVNQMSQVSQKITHELNSRVSARRVAAGTDDKTQMINHLANAKKLREQNKINIANKKLMRLRSEYDSMPLAVRDQKLRSGVLKDPYKLTIDSIMETQPK